MSRTMHFGLALLLLCCSANAAAMFIPHDERVFANGATWAQPSLFWRVSWNEVNAQCPGGVCGAGSSLRGYDLSGWVWADSVAVTSLLNSYLAADGIGGADLLDPFDPNDSYGLITDTTPDWVRAIRSDFFYTSYDHTGGYYLDAFVSGDVGRHYDTSSVYWPPDNRNNRIRSRTRNSGDDTRDGVFFFCTSDCPQAPVVPTLPLFGLALIALVGQRWRPGVGSRITP